MGADLVVGSLIKNPGGGIAPTGGYIAGRKDLVELCAYRLNAPGLGKDLAARWKRPVICIWLLLRAGVVCEAIKTAIYAQCMLELLGKNPVPRYCDDHNDIVTCFDAALRMRSSASVRVFRLQVPWTAMPPRNLLRSRAIPTRWSWQAAALHRAAPSSFPATARCVSRTPATCRAV